MPTPVNVSCAPEKPEWASVDCRATKRLKLFFPASSSDNAIELKAKAMKGRKAIVRGTLHRADTVGEITPIYMDVKEIQPLQPPQKPE